jgi:phosphate:Na+ symporter
MDLVPYNDTITPGWLLLLVLGLIGGLAIFLLGIEFTSQSMNKAFGARIRKVILTVTKSPIRGVMFGTFLTGIVQSSSAATVLVVSFVSSQWMTLSQSIAVLLGAGIGTTITAQFIAFHFTDYALPMIGAAFLFQILFKNKKLKLYARIFLGVGLLFFGMKIMGDTVGPLQEFEYFLTIIGHVENPLFGILVGLIITSIVQASAATIGITMVLALQGLITLEGAIAVVFGANIGTCVTAILASLNSSIDAKRVAMGNILLRIAAVILVVFWIPYFAEFIRWLSPGGTGDVNYLPRQIANAHTVFNIGMTILFLPFSNTIAALLTRMLPEPVVTDSKFRLKYIEDRHVSSPMVAMAQIKREIIRMAEKVQHMIQAIKPTVEDETTERLETVEESDDQIDFFRRNIPKYITRVTENELDEDQSNECMRYLWVVTELELIGDDISKVIVPMLKKKIIKGVSFSREGEKELVSYYDKIAERFEKVLAAFSSDNKKLAQEIIQTKHSISLLHQSYRRRHYARLMKDVAATKETASIHIDLLNSLKKINSHITDIARAVSGDIEPWEKPEHPGESGHAQGDTASGSAPDIQHDKQGDASL